MPHIKLSNNNLLDHIDEEQFLIDYEVNSDNEYILMKDKED